MTTCALVGASEFNSTHFAEAAEDGLFDYIIAVDGGYSSLEAIGIMPDLALGDFDSLGYTPKNVRACAFPVHKNESDMELALQRAKRRKMDEVVIYGALGGRLDHTLANLQLFAAYSEKGLSVTAVGMQEQIAFLTGPGTFEIPALEEGTVSVFAMNDKCRGAFEVGLEYPLEECTLTNRTSLGLSNQLQGEAAVVGVEKGTLAIFLPV